MKKILLKFTIFIGLFIGFISNIFAFDANLQLDKSETDINDYINLRVEINSTEGGEIGITDIKGLENFDLIGKSQSQSNSTSIVVVNGTTENKTKTTINLDLTLKPKAKGEFVLGPAILKSGSGQVETNSLKIKVGGNNLFINNNHLNVNNGKNTITNVGQQKKAQKDVEIETFNDIKKRDFDNSKDLYLLLILLLITGIGFYILNKNNFGLLDKKILNKKDHSNINTNEKLGNDINFEKVEEIKYPEINDNDFITKVDNILRNKLELKFNIKNINSKTYDELLKEIGKNDLLENLIKLINNAKYSNNIGNNNKILELLKEI